MKPLAEAQREVLAAMPLLPEVDVPLEQALGLVLSRPVTAHHDVPPFANSAMDGFAVRASDVNHIPITLPVIEDVPAGRVPRSSLAPGTAIRIMTGAPLPEGADAVVKVEDTEATPESVEIRVAVEPGSAVREAGGDVRAGTRVLAAGERLGPAHLGVLASLGVAAPTVRRRPRAAILSTGDEVLPPTTLELGPGKIRDSNRSLLRGMLEEVRVEVVDLGIVGDDEEDLRSALVRGAEDADLVISSGGVSMGDYDLVKHVLGELGTVEMWKVAMQPAKPFAFGTVDGVPLFGLPGNPVSVVVAFEQFVRPALLKMMGSPRLFRPRVPGHATTGFDTDPVKTVFIRVVASPRNGEWWAEPSGGQQSNMLASLARANAFAVVPAGRGTIEAGEPVDLEMFTWPEERTEEEVVGGAFATSG